MSTDFNSPFFDLSNFRTYNLFISHSWDYADTYDGLVNLLHSKPGFLFNNLSVPKENPIPYLQSDSELYQKIKSIMQKADVILILAGVYASYSRWINLEIQAAKELVVSTTILGGNVGKPIIAIEPWGAQKTSQVVKDNANEIVGWNTDSIVDAIKRCTDAPYLRTRQWI